MNKPIAYIPAIGLPTLTEEKAWCVANATKFDESDIPLYTHPVKELTDEEIIHIWNTCETDDEVEELVMKDFILFARAILRKAQEK